MLSEACIAAPHGVLKVAEDEALIFRDGTEHQEKVPLVVAEFLQNLYQLEQPQQHIKNFITTRGLVRRVKDKRKLRAYLKRSSGDLDNLLNELLNQLINKKYIYLQTHFFDGILKHSDSKPAPLPKIFIYSKDQVPFLEEKLKLIKLDLKTFGGDSSASCKNALLLTSDSSRIFISPKMILGFSRSLGGDVFVGSTEPAMRVVPKKMTETYSESELLNLHSLYLGQSLSGALRTAFNENISSQIMFNFLQSSRDLLSLLTKKKGKIKLSLFGEEKGGSNTPSPFIYLREFFDQRLLQSEEKYWEVMSTTSWIETTAGFSLSRSPFVQRLGLGLDLSSILPPFAPGSSGQNDLFISILRLLDPTACFVHHSKALIWSDNVKQEAPLRTPRNPGGVCDIIQFLLYRFKAFPAGVSVEENLRQFGLFILSAVSSGFENFRREYHQSVLVNTEKAIADLKLMLKIYGRKPKYWAQDMDDLIDELGLRLRYKPFLLKNCSTDEEDIDVFESVKNYGSLLTVWPEIWHSSRALACSD